MSQSDDICSLHKKPAQFVQFGKPLCSLCLSHTSVKVIADELLPIKQAVSTKSLSVFPRELKTIKSRQQIVQKKERQLDQECKALAKQINIFKEEQSRELDRLLTYWQAQKKSRLQELNSLFEHILTVTNQFNTKQMLDIERETSSAAKISRFKSVQLESWNRRLQAISNQLNKKLKTPLINIGKLNKLFESQLQLFSFLDLRPEPRKPTSPLKALAQSSLKHTGHSNKITGIALLKKQTPLIATCSLDGSIRIFDSRSLQLAGIHESPTESFLNVNSFKSGLLTGSLSKVLKLWHLVSKQKRVKGVRVEWYELKESRVMTGAAAGKVKVVEESRILACSKKSIIQWNVNNDTNRYYQGPNAKIVALQANKDIVVVAYANKQLLVFRAKSAPDHLIPLTQQPTALHLIEDLLIGTQKGNLLFYSFKESAILRQFNVVNQSILKVSLNSRRELMVSTQSRVVVQRDEQRRIQILRGRELEWCWEGEQVWAVQSTKNLHRMQLP